MKSIRSYISNSNWSNFPMPPAFQGYISEENEEDESQDVSDSQSSKIMIKFMIYLEKYS